MVQAASASVTAPAHVRAYTEAASGDQLRRRSVSKDGHLQHETARAILQLEGQLERLSKRCQDHELRIQSSLERLQNTLYITFPNELAALDDIDITAEETSSSMLVATATSIPPLEARLRTARSEADEALSAFETALGTDDDGVDLTARVTELKEQLVKEKQGFEHSMRFKNRLRRVIWYSLYGIGAIISTLILVGYLSRS